MFQIKYTQNPLVWKVDQSSHLASPPMVCRSRRFRLFKLKASAISRCFWTLTLCVPWWIPYLVSTYVRVLPESISLPALISSLSISLRLALSYITTGPLGGPLQIQRADQARRAESRIEAISCIQRPSTTGNRFGDPRLCLHVLPPSPGFRE